MMPPFAGQALNAGIRDVANLAWKVAANVQGTGTDALVGTYQAERRPHAVDMVRLSHRIGKVVMNVNPTLTAIRDAAITASGIVPAAKGWLAGMKFLKQPHFTDGCVVAPAADLPKPAAALIGPLALAARGPPAPPATPSPWTRCSARAGRCCASPPTAAHRFEVRRLGHCWEPTTAARTSADRRHSRHGHHRRLRGSRRQRREPGGPARPVRAPPPPRISEQAASAALAAYVPELARLPAGGNRVAGHTLTAASGSKKERGGHTASPLLCCPHAQLSSSSRRPSD